MPAFKWQHRPTKHFGTVAVPIADIDLQSADGRFRSFALQVDSGAVVSLLRRSAGELLGLKVPNGRRIELSSVGGANTVAYVHALTARFSDTMIGPIEFAIADSESVPNLLGRRGVFDARQIDFDSTLRTTTIFNRWLNDDQAILWTRLCEASKRVTTAWPENPLPPPGNEAAGQLIRRGEQLVASAAGLLKLGRTFDGPLFVRALFEASLQVEYLLQSPAERGRLFLDFAKITRFNYSRRIAEHPQGPIGRSVAESPLRVDGDLRNKQEYQVVAERFRRSKKRLWDNWYCMALAELADQLGRRGEYDIWYKLASGWAHADPFATAPWQSSVGSEPHSLLMASFHFFGRMLFRAAEAKKIVLDSEQFETLARSLNNLD